MSKQSQRLSKVAKEFNVGVDTILEFLASMGTDDLNRNSKISSETYEVLVNEYQPHKKVKAEAKELKKAESEQKNQLKDEVEKLHISAPKIEGLKIVAKVDVSENKAQPKKDIEQDIDEIYHLACPASPPKYQQDPIYTCKINFMGTLNLLGLAKEKKAKILLSSTSEVYGEPEIFPTPESSCLRQTSIYGASKLAGESYIQAYSEYSDFLSQELSQGVKFDAKLYSYFLAKGVL